MKRFVLTKYGGFCFGVKKAVDTALQSAKAGRIFSLGEITHNELVIAELARAGVVVVDSLDGLSDTTVIIRSHGATRQVFEQAKKSNITLLDLTCPFVAKIHAIVQSHHEQGFAIVIVGDARHPEIIGINGWCEGQAHVISTEEQASQILPILPQKVCLVAQTTFDDRLFAQISKIFALDHSKTLVKFDTICYTTICRRKEAELLARHSDAVVVVGSTKSANTTKLFELCKRHCQACFLVGQAEALSTIDFGRFGTIAIVAGASAPYGLIMEVKEYMSKSFSEVQNEEFINAVEGGGSHSCRPDDLVKGAVISADESGIKIELGGKLDGIIRAEEVELEGEYDPASYPIGMEIEAIVLGKKDAESNCILLSKKKLDKIKIGDKFVETIRNGEEFELVVDRITKGGVRGSIGTYKVFVPASQIKESFVRDLNVFLGKKLRLSALEIDDTKKEIIASQRIILERERKEKEEIFWANVVPNVVVSGRVKRATNFGAFVSVDGFDCLARIGDLSWTKIDKVEDVLTIGKDYDFLVLSVDRNKGERGQVALGYKQLQQHPFVAALEKYPVGTIVEGKIVRLVTFGAFVEIEKGVDGLVHVSEASTTYVKNINDVLKVGDIVKVMVINVDPEHRKINLSIKACLQEEGGAAPAGDQQSAQPAPKRPRKPRVEEQTDDATWSESVSHNPLAELLKDLDSTNS